VKNGLAYCSRAKFTQRLLHTNGESRLKRARIFEVIMTRNEIFDLCSSKRISQGYVCKVVTSHTKRSFLLVKISNLKIGSSFNTVDVLLLLWKVSFECGNFQLQMMDSSLRLMVSSGLYYKYILIVIGWPSCVTPVL